MLVVVISLFIYLFGFVFSVIKLFDLNNLIESKKINNQPNKKITKIIYLVMGICFLVSFILNLSYVIIYFMEN